MSGMIMLELQLPAGSDPDVRRSISAKYAHWGGGLFDVVPMQARRNGGWSDRAQWMAFDFEELDLPSHREIKIGGPVLSMERQGDVVHVKLRGRPFGSVSVADYRRWVGAAAAEGGRSSRLAQSRRAMKESTR